MQISESIVAFGTDAVLCYGTISGQQDNALPETFLGGHIAPRLHDQLHCRVLVEENYLHVVSSCGVPITDKVIGEIGNLRADIAIYRDGFPPVVVEFKIIDESTRASSALADSDKINKLSNMCKVTGLLGLLIFQNGGPLEDKITKVEKTLRMKLQVGEPRQSADGNWRWRFACAAL